MVPATVEEYRKEAVAVPAIVSIIRGEVRDWLSKVGLEVLSDDALTVVSEMLNNVVVRPDCPIFVLTARPLDQGRLRLGLHDPSTALPAKRALSDDAESGRGLWIIEALAERCGVAPHEDGGKVVWAVLGSVGDRGGAAGAGHGGAATGQQPHHGGQAGDLERPA